jgi:MFS family permease
MSGEASRVRGWGVVAGCFLATGATAAVVTGFAVFYVAITAELGWDRALVAGAFSISSLVMGFSGPMIGWAVDRLGPGRVMIAGGVLVALGLAASSGVQAVWQYYLAFGAVASLGVACLGSVPQNVALAERFSHRRATVFGLTAAGAGAGTFTLVPLAQWLISTIGWRGAYACFAGGLVLVTLTLVVTLGWRPGRSVVSSSTPAPGSRDVRQSATALVRYLLRNRPALLLTAVVFCSGFQRTIMVVHFVPYLLTVGYAAPLAAMIFASSDLLRSFGGAGMGYVSDRVGARAMYVLSVACAAGAVLAYTLPIAASAVFAWGLALVYGLSSGGIQPSSAAIQASIYAPRDRGRLFGLTSMGYGVGAAASAWLGGYLFERAGGYQVVLMLASAALLLMAAGVWQAVAIHQRASGPRFAA